jgi:glycerol-3-phosphate dehydrogenase (NAD(P)+)
MTGGLDGWGAGPAWGGASPGGSLPRAGTVERVAVLGAGAWGTALARLLAEKGNEVVLWSRRRDLCDAVNATHENARYLPGVELPPALSCTDDLPAALRAARAVLFVVPSHAMREVARAAAPHVQQDADVVSATKGIEVGSLMFMDEILREELPAHSRRRLAVLSGPSFATELARGMPTAVVVAARDEAVCAGVVARFRTAYLRVYASDDVVGVECGGALKNVVAIAAGAASGLGFGHNARAALITRGLAEIANLAVARGGSPLTVAGLAGMGDLVLTCTGELSRNRTLGYELGRGSTLAAVLSRLGHVAEGVPAAKSAHDLSRKLGVSMPITSEVYAVLYEGKPVPKAVGDLMARELGYEFGPRALSRATSK